MGVSWGAAEVRTYTIGDIELSGKRAAWAVVRGNVRRNRRDRYESAQLPRYRDRAARRRYVPLGSLRVREQRERRHREARGWDRGRGQLYSRLMGYGVPY
jgi:hypothetical protein